VTSTVVIQSKQGIGDVIWHLPYLRAIAAASPGGKVVFLALPSTYAQELLQAEPCVERTIYFENRGSELRRIAHQIHLTHTLRGLRCDTAWILDVGVRPAIAALLAGIANRIGVGIGPQRWFITNRGGSMRCWRKCTFLAESRSRTCACRWKRSPRCDGNTTGTRARGSCSG
jgi:heptosyltransferase-2